MAGRLVSLAAGASPPFDIVIEAVVIIVLPLAAGVEWCHIPEPVRQERYTSTRSVRECTPGVGFIWRTAILSIPGVHDVTIFIIATMGSRTS